MDSEYINLLPNDIVVAALSWERQFREMSDFNSIILKGSTQILLKFHSRSIQIPLATRGFGVG